MIYVPAIERPENGGYSDYVRLDDGQLRLECCGCGLVHDVQVVAEPCAAKPRTLIRFRRNLRATAAKRRGKRR